MKKGFIFLIILLIPALVSAQTELNYNQYKSLVMDVNITSNLSLVPEKTDYNVEYVEVGLTFFPRDAEFQQVFDFRTIPSAIEKDSSLNFRWNYPTQKDLSFEVFSKVSINNDYLKINEKIDFPIKNLPDEYAIYTKPSDNIDSDNDEIIKTASSLAEGQDDLYMVTFNIAQWVEKNIKYSLNTLTAEVSQPASWVLNSKEGVCDELTSLFIAMLRSLGIPARYVSGVAYTNWNNMDDWGPHAWAEVYFPNYGWVPFDLTYTQFGSVDPSHIILKQSIDSNEPTTNYQWKGHDVDLVTNKLIIDVNEIEKGDIKDKLVDIRIKPVYPSVGFGSYNILELSLENLENFYLPLEIYLSKSAEVVSLDGNKREVLLAPRAKKNVYWIIKVNEDLKSDFVYTLPVGVTTDFLEKFETSFTSTKGDPIYSFDDVKSFIDEKNEEQQKVYSENVDLNCKTPDNYYVEDSVIIECKVKNSGNRFLEGLNVCLKNDCKDFDLGINQGKTLSFSTNFEKPGNFDIPVKAINKDISKTIYQRVSILDKPAISINEISFPSEVLYNESYRIVFNVKKESQSNPLDVNIKLSEKWTNKEWQVDELKADQEFILELQGRDLSEGKNDFNISVGYYDRKGNEYHDNVEFAISLVEVNFWQSIALFFNDLGKITEKIFS